MATNKSGRYRDANWKDIQAWLDEVQHGYNCSVSFVVLSPSQNKSNYHARYACEIVLPNHGVLEPRYYRASREVSAVSSHDVVPMLFGLVVEAISAMERDPQSKFWKRGEEA